MYIGNSSTISAHIHLILLSVSSRVLVETSSNQMQMMHFDDVFKFIQLKCNTCNRDVRHLH